MEFLPTIYCFSLPQKVNSLELIDNQIEDRKRDKVKDDSSNFFFRSKQDKSLWCL